MELIKDGGQLAKPRLIKQQSHLGPQEPEAQSLLLKPLLGAMGLGGEQGGLSLRMRDKLSLEGGSSQENHSILDFLQTSSQGAKKLAKTGRGPQTS